MKTILKFSLLAATAAILTTGAALADDQMNQNRLAMQRAEMQKNQRTTTVGVYASGRGVDRQATTADSRRSERKLIQRNDPHGPGTFHYVPARYAPRFPVPAEISRWSARQTAGDFPVLWLNEFSQHAQKTSPPRRVGRWR